MEKEGDVYYIPCKINGLKLKFIFDTGASQVSISLTEAQFMLKNGYLSKDDIIGLTYTQLANGDITENTRINLKTVEFAGLYLYNVEALVVNNLSAPLLFGQSAISKLGTVQINPANNTLTILNSNSNQNRHLAIATPPEKTKCEDHWYPKKDTLRTCDSCFLKDGVLDNSAILATISKNELVQFLYEVYKGSNYINVRYKYYTGYIDKNCLCKYLK